MLFPNIFERLPEIVQIIKTGIVTNENYLALVKPKFPFSPWYGLRYK